jgi:ribonucleoside-diphosphate reductase alpha chain
MPNSNTFKINIDEKRNKNITHFGKEVLKDRYLLPGEDFQDLFVRVARSFASSGAHAQRLYDYMSKMWFMPATPILSNGGTKRGLPISCFLNEVGDSIDGIVDTWVENVWLASKGGGIGTYWGDVRSINEPVGRNGKTSGIVPFIKVQDSMTLAISQGSLRRGSSAVYLQINHPEIEEFIDIRKPTGGDINRRSLNIHHGVVITDDFMKAVERDAIWPLISPHSGETMLQVKARDLWIKLLTSRIETGEPYLLFIDAVNRHIPEAHKKLKLNVKTSNLCSEITLPTGKDHLGNVRTAVCCLSSLNLEYFNEWEKEASFIPDIMEFLDNVLEHFINSAPDHMKNAKYSAYRERSVGLGVMGFHSFLQSKMVPMESVMSKVWNSKIFKHVNKKVNKASKDLAEKRGPCPDAKDAGLMERFTNKMAIAPTASISTIAGNCSPGIEPYVANSYTHKTLSGSFVVRNKYLETLLEKKDFNNSKVWSSISTHEGSVSHLTFLSDGEKEVFKTAQEIDQNRLIRLAAERTPYISQSQSLNLFMPGNVSKSYLHQVHFDAWKKGIKSLYYLRSTSIQRAEKISHSVLTTEDEQPSIPSIDQEECESCQ